MTQDLLVVDNLCAGYQGQDVVHDICLRVGQGEVVALIGSNGAGKSTMLKAVCGLLPVSTGSVRFDNDDVTAATTHRLARSGLVYVPAERNLFHGMSVKENLVLGAYPRTPKDAVINRVYDTFPRLRERSKQLAGTLSGGERQMLAVGRALMSAPKLLMLDEPTTGLSPLLAQEAYAALQQLRTEGLTILVAEQQVPLALELADRGYVLDHGRIGLAGTAGELASNPEVQRAYLGV